MLIEFSDLPIDAEVIEAENDKLISIAGGCISCSFGSDLSAEMLKLCGMERRFDHILTEAYGVARPERILGVVGLIGRVSPDGRVVL